MYAGHKRRRATSARYKSIVSTGSGLLNNLIDKLPIELHLPGYQYCGPGTKLTKRIARGDRGINPLDAACKIHDIAYANKKTLEDRHKADYELEQKAWKRVKSPNSSLREKGAAWFVTTAMKAKRKLGMGLKQKRLKKKINKRKTKTAKQIAFGSGLRNNIRHALNSTATKKALNNNILKVANNALGYAKTFVKKNGGKKRIRTPRIIPIPKSGGVLPLIPIFAGLSALGTLASGASSIVKALNTVKNTRQNNTTDSIAIGKKGNGIFLKPYRSGYGLFLNKSKN